MDQANYWTQHDVRSNIRSACNSSVSQEKLRLTAIRSSPGGKPDEQADPIFDSKHAKPKAISIGNVGVSAARGSRPANGSRKKQATSGQTAGETADRKRRDNPGETGKFTAAQGRASRNTGP